MGLIAPSSRERAAPVTIWAWCSARAGGRGKVGMGQSTTWLRMECRLPLWSEGSFWTTWRYISRRQLDDHYQGQTILERCARRWSH